MLEMYNIKNSPATLRAVCAALLALLMTACSEEAPMSTQELALPPSSKAPIQVTQSDDMAAIAQRQAEFRLFWQQFRRAVLDGDKNGLLALTDFPLTVRGEMDFEPQRSLDSAQFIAKLEQLLRQKIDLDHSDDIAPTTVLEILKQQTDIVISDSGDVIWANLHFQRREAGWRLVMVYYSEDVII